jgi:crotonobetainyl-CoA:carnitine CoA-transferase CaiB-like acyl-CoA transferase
MVLGDLGADVVRVEERGGGRMTREQGAERGGSNGAEARRRAAFNALGRNKRSIVLDLKHEDARGVLHRLCRDADVFIEGFRPGVVARLGCDYETLQGLNPRLVYCSLSGYGQDGPYRDLVGHDVNYISVGGALGVIGTPNGAPVIPYNIIADYAGGGMHAAMAILAALLARGRTGEGQQVDIAMSDGVAYMMAPVMAEYFASGTVPSPGDMGLNGGAPYYNVYRCRDGKYLSVGCIEPWFWADLCHAIDRDELIPGQFDPDSSAQTIQELQELFAQRDREEWWELLTKAGDVAVAKVYSIDEMVEDPQNVHRRMALEVGQVDGEPVRQVGIGPKLSATPGAIRTLGAVGGQHTREVLEELGYSVADVERLVEAGAVECA